MEKQILDITLEISVRGDLKFYKTEEEKPPEVVQGERIASILREELARDLPHLEARVNTKLVFRGQCKQVSLIFNVGKGNLGDYDLKNVLTTIMEKVYGKRIRGGGSEQEPDSLH